MTSLILIALLGIIVILMFAIIISSSIKQKQILEKFDDTNKQILEKFDVTNKIVEEELGDVKNHLIKLRTENQIAKVYIETEKKLRG